MYGNISYDTVTLRESPSSKDNKAPNDEIHKNEDAPSHEQMYDTIDSGQQVETQLYEIPDHDFQFASASGVADET